MNGARQKYLAEIIRLIEEGEDIVIVSSDYAAPVLDKLKMELPERFVSVGIAEQNLVQISCGLALAGHHVVAYGKAPFPCVRAYDQLRCAVAMMDVPIQIVSVGTGFDIPEYGATHFCAEDISIMRTLPNFDILTVSDEWMAEKCAHDVLTNKNPIYIRFDKYCDGRIYGEKIQPEWDTGFVTAQKTGDGGLAILTNSYYVRKMMDIAKKIWIEYNIPITVIDLFRLPFSKNSLVEFLRSYIGVVTIEEHILRGGIGSELLELKEEYSLRIPLERIGIDFKGHYPDFYGDREYFLMQYDMSDQNIEKRITDFYRRISK